MRLPVFTRFSTTAFWRLCAVLILGFASGLPLALTGQSLQAWLTVDGVDVATIGFFALVGQPYAYKFLWSPLMDRFEPPFLGRRRGWLVLAQLALAGMLWSLTALTPAANPVVFALMATVIAFLSASQDVVIDAYRTDIVQAEERGTAAALTVLGYRLAMIVSGGVAFILADQFGAKYLAAGMTETLARSAGWAQVYRWMAVCMVLLAAVSAVIPRLPTGDGPLIAKSEFFKFVASILAALAAAGGAYALWPALPATGSWLGQWAMSALTAVTLTGVGLLASVGMGKLSHFAARAEISGFIYMLLGVVSGFFVGQLLADATWLALSALQGWPTPLSAEDPALHQLSLWHDLWRVVIEVAAAALGALIAARWATFRLLLDPMQEYFSRERAVAFLMLIVLYKLGDAFAGTLSTTFLLKGVGFTQTEVGIVNKLIGMWVTIGGILLGGVLMRWLGLYRSLLLFGVLQAASNLGFWLLAVYGKGAFGSFALPTHEIVHFFVNKPIEGVATQIDYLLVTAVSIENLTGGMGTAAAVALLMSLCNQRFSATHYALLSAFAAFGRIYVGPISGVLTESIGWANFFIFSLAASAPGVLAVWWLRQPIRALAPEKTSLLVDD